MHRVHAEFIIKRSWSLARLALFSLRNLSDGEGNFLEENFIIAETFGIPEIPLGDLLLNLSGLNYATIVYSCRISRGEANFISIVRLIDTHDEIWREIRANDFSIERTSFIQRRH